MVVVVAIISIPSEINSTLKGAAFAEKKISFYTCHLFKKSLNYPEMQKKNFVEKKLSEGVTFNWLSNSKKCLQQTVAVPVPVAVTNPF